MSQYKPRNKCSKIRLTMKRIREAGSGCGIVSVAAWRELLLWSSILFSAFWYHGGRIRGHTKALKTPRLYGIERFEWPELRVTRQKETADSQRRLVTKVPRQTSGRFFVLAFVKLDKNWTGIPTPSGKAARVIWLRGGVSGLRLLPFRACVWEMTNLYCKKLYKYINIKKYIL